MAEQIDEFQLAAWRVFLNMHAAVIDLIERELAGAKLLPLSSYDVLLALYAAPDQRLRMRDLAEAVVLSRSGLTRLVDRLEREGLLARERCGSDRRGAYAVLLPAGMRALRRGWPTYAQGIMRHFTSHLNDAEAAILTGVLERILAAARQARSS